MSIDESNPQKHVGRRRTEEPSDHINAKHELHTLRGIKRKLERAITPTTTFRARDLTDLADGDLTVSQIGNALERIEKNPPRCLGVSVTVEPCMANNHRTRYRVAEARP